MAFRPIGRKANLWGMHMMYEIGGICWRYRFVSSSFQYGHDVISKLNIELFSKITRMAPQ
jgi:hypothetical protein